MRSSGRVRRLFYAIVPAIVLFGGVEVGLRLVGFRHDVVPMTMRFGYPSPRELVDVFRPDARVFWRLRPNSEFDAIGPVRINDAGYRGPLPAVERPPGAIRLAVLGDSVAFGFGGSWPDLLRNRLQVRFPDRAFEVLNFGVPGYSSLQGARLYEDEVAALAPDIVIVAFGWNDHWLATGGLEDAGRRPPAEWIATVGTRLGGLRVVQAMHFLYARLRPPARSVTGIRRVPPARFEENLARIFDGVRATGGRSIALSLPSGLVADDFPAYLIDSGFTASAGEAIEDHRRYGDVIQSTAAAAGAALLDLDAVFRGPDGRPRTGLLLEDGLHPTPAGYEKIAEVVEEAVVGMLDDPGRIR